MTDYGYGAAVNRQHAKRLKASAITREVALARGYRSVVDKQELAELDFGPRQRLPGLVIPFYAVDGEVALYQLRPDEPRTDKRGRPQKYLVPPRTEMDLDVSPLARDRVVAATEELWITEGVLKADAAVSAGLACIALAGVWIWQRDGASLAAWQAVSLKDRAVRVAFDSDVMTNPRVTQALDGLEAFLVGEGARVVRVILPGGPGGKKVGLDDYLAAHGVGALLDLARACDPAHRGRVAKQKADLYARETARHQYDAEQASRRFYTLPRHTLPQAVAAVETTAPERVAALHRVGYNTTITGQYKTGKSTLGANLLRALADEEHFLDRFPVLPPGGRIGYVNYELDEHDFFDWLGDVGIRKTDRIAPLNLRGRPFSLAHAHGQEELVRWAQDMDVEVLHLDPHRRAFAGFGKENDNDDVNRFTGVLDEVKTAAGIRDVWLYVHTGRAQHEAGEEHARGATALDDWADERWLLVKKAGVRFFYADGRLPAVPEFALTYDAATRRLAAGDGNRRQATDDKLLHRLLELVGEQPGLTRGQLEEALRLRKGSGLTRVLRVAEDDGHVQVQVVGRARHHYLWGDLPTEGSGAP